MNPQSRSTRKVLRLPVSLGGKLPALTADVSKTGCRLELPQVFLPGSKVHGYVLHKNTELPFQGEVVWSQPGDPRASVYSTTGVRFTELSPALSRLLGAAKPRRNA
jgi:hypothetical protein